MIYLLYVVHVLVCVFLILVVLLQQGKGADLSVFGGGSTQTAFGARSATTLLHKLTVASFVIFILTTISIALFKGGPERRHGDGGPGQERGRQDGAGQARLRLRPPRGSAGAKPARVTLAG